MEEIVAHAHEVKGKLGEKIATFGDQGILSKELARINIEVPLAFDSETMKYNGPNVEALTKIFEDLEFRTTLKRILGGGSSNSAKPKSPLAEQIGLLAMPLHRV